MEQLDIFNASIVDEVTLYAAIEPALLAVMDANTIPRKYLIGRKNKTGFSLVYKSTVFASWNFKGKSCCVTLPLYARDLIPQNFGMKLKMKDSKISVIVPGPEYVSKYTNLFAELLDEVIDRTIRDYSCCSRYIECSELGQCVNPHCEISMECRYKVHLKHGDNFFKK